MSWYLVSSLGILIAILVALPVIVRLRTGNWGNVQTFRETYSAIRSTPEAKEQQRRRNYKAFALLIFGLPLGSLLVSLCEWMHYPRSIYLPIATGSMLLSSNLLANHLYNRVAKASANKPKLEIEKT